jgi:hydrogenase maturation protein HypF
VVEVQGPEASVGAFAAALAAALPKAARIEDHRVEPLVPAIESGPFRIAESLRTAYTLPPIPPDLALCDQCAREILDPGDRRYLYPFTSCTQCGPRYTIVVDTPFDRHTTTLEPFPLCAECRSEYEDPSNRRFHAQTTACPRCGPRLVLRDAAGRTLPGDPLLAAIRALSSGATVAIMGLGGFHLAADPSSEAALRRLRADKDRERKPFALMARDLAAAGALASIEPEMERLLASPSSPIVILPARPEASRLLAKVSDTGTLGIMLPYTPLHYLLFHHPETPVPYDTLVMTSGNLRDEPIHTDPDRALAELGGIADLFLVHDRRIAFRADDSVLRPSGPGPVFLRRSRGYVPGMVTLASPVPQATLALGGDLKNAPALALGTDVYLSPYGGDLESLAAQDAFEAQVRAMLDLYRVEPERIVHDAHPLYISTRWARVHAVGRRAEVQHHHAHLLSVMAEQGLEEAIGLAFDGTGYGPDGTIWGGEFLWASRSSYRRLGHVAVFGLPGGEAAVRNPLRVAYAVLREAHPREAGLLRIEPEVASLIEDMLARQVHVPTTSSLGRVFDAAAAVLGLVEHVSYEGEGPIRLEGLAAQARGRNEGPGGLEIPLRDTDGGFLVDVAPALAALVRAVHASTYDPAALALGFHQAVAEASLAGAQRMREITGLADIALSGGVFQNVLLLDLLVPRLREAGFSVHGNVSIPPGDGGLAVGQAWYLGDFQHEPE